MFKDHKFPKNIFTWLIAAMVFILIVFLIIVISPKRILGDFDVYYHAGQNYLAKAPVYTAHGGIEEFKYLPLFALLFSPFALMKEVPALYVWNILNIISFFALFYLFYKLRLMSFSKFKDILIIVLLFASIGRYLFANIKLGQVNILLCFLMFLTIYLEINKKYFWSAFVLAFTLMIKFFPLLILVYFVLTRRFKIVVFTLILIVFFLTLPSVYTGFDLNFKYLHDWALLLKSSPAALFYSVKNYSILSFYSWLFIARHEFYYVMDYDLINKTLTPQVYHWWLGTCLILFVSFYHDIISFKDKDLHMKLIDYACLFVCALLFNPLAYLNALIFLTVPYFFVLKYLIDSKLKTPNARIVSYFTFLSLIFLALDNRFFFKDIRVFSKILELKPLMWSIVLVYLDLYIIKFFKNEV